MKSILKSMAILGGGSLVTVVAGLITAKVNAIELGPSGLGLYALFQSLLGVGSIIAGFGLATAIVRFGADSIATEDYETLGRYWNGSWLLLWMLGLPSAAVLVVLRTPISALVTGSVENSGAVGWVALAMLFSLAGGLYSGLINAHHRVAVLARLAVYSAIGQAAFTVFLVVRFGTKGIPFAILASSIVQWVVSLLLARRHLSRTPKASLREARGVVGSLARFGGPYALSMLAGTGVQLLLPLIVLWLFDQTSVGYVRASSTITVTYVAFLLKAMGQDYYPRLSAVARDRRRINELVNQQLEAIFIVAVPLIFMAMALAPIVIPILYSRSFAPAVGILEWQLVGDTFKFASWALAFTMLAQGRSSSYLVTESSGGMLLLLTTYFALRWWGVVGFGVAYAASYLCYLVIVYLVVRRNTGFRFVRMNARLLWAVGAVAFAVRLVMLGLVGPWVYILPGVVALAAGTLSLRRGRSLWGTGLV